MIGVCIVTYNEEKYITECIDSALVQVCTEPVRVYVANDCSTDGTADVCRGYGDRIVFVDRERNLGLVGNTMALLDQIRKDGCEYIAMLDGDDYWCDDHKLQKQIDYMHEHAECGLVHTCVDRLYPDRVYVDQRTTVIEGDVFSRINELVIANCSVLFKTNLLQHINFSDFVNHGFKSCDYVMYVIFSKYTQFGFLPDHTAVWRRGHESVSGSKNVDKQIEYIQNDLIIWEYLSTLFPEDWSFSKENANYYFHEKAFHVAFRLGDRKRAISEYKLMNICDQQRLRLKYLVSNSAIITKIWRIYKNG